MSAFLKQQSVGHRPKKSKVFTLEEMERFLDNASDDEYLLQKVILTKTNSMLIFLEKK